MRFKFLTKNQISKIPTDPGVYAFKDKRILYIGKAANIKERVKNHFQKPGFKESIFLDKTKKIGFIKTNSEIEALILEANLIKKHQPKFNVIWKDDKNYFFVAMTKEDFPRIFWTHQIKLKAKSCKLKAKFVGPFVDGTALKQTLKILRKIFPYRSCKKIPKRPCLWYHLNRCFAPCLLKSELEKERLKKASKKNAENLMKTLKKGKKTILRDLKKEMKFYSKKQEFEEAAKIRDKIEALERVFLHSKIFGIERGKEKWEEIEKGLKKILKTKKRISRIEAYDVSNIGGKLAAGSMVAFVNGKAEKNLYRRFKIKFTKRPNDLKMIEECLARRFKHREWGFPDLILIDGGKAQLNAALKAKKKKIKIVALAKREKKLFVEGKEKAIFLKDLEDKLSNFLLKVSEEAHRFAISYHKKLREKALLKK